MTVTTYKTTDDIRKLEKTLNGLQSFTIKQLESIDMLQPVFVVDTNNFNYDANYLYCDTFKRYYFINDITVKSGRRVELKCSVDVLMSFSSEIKNCTGILIRSESQGKPLYIPDTKLPLTGETKTQFIKFPNQPFDNQNNSFNFVLITSAPNTI